MKGRNDVVLGFGFFITQKIQGSREIGPAITGQYLLHPSFFTTPSLSHRDINAIFHGRTGIKSHI